MDDREGGSDNDFGAGHFPIDPEDGPAIDKIVKLVRALLVDMQPADIRGVAAALYALERLPRTTPGVSVAITISTPERQEGRYGWVELTIDEDEFSLGTGEYFYDPRIGGDTESHTVFEMQSGSDWREGDIGVWLERARVVARNCKISIEDNSDDEDLDWR